MNAEQREAFLTDELRKALAKRPDAIEWLDMVGNYFSAVDDIVDEDAPKAAIIKATFMAFEVYNHPFWITNREKLGSVIITASITYGDTVKWESEKGWKLNYADALRHAGQDLLRLVVYHVAGYDKIAELSPLLREVTYERHKNDPTFHQGSSEEV